MRTSRSARPRWRKSSIALALCVLVGGCAIGSEDIEHWTQTQKGPEKILRLLSSSRYPLALRAEAALAMVEMDRAELASLHELGLALDALEGREPQTVDAIVEDLAPRLRERMKGKPGEPATPAQIRAKDAAVKLLSYVDGGVHDSLVEGVVDFFAEDFAARSLLGDVSAEQVARKVGAPAVARLVAAMDAKMPEEALIKLAELVAELGDAPTKKKAAERLVAIERELEGEAFAAWLTEQIKAQQGEVLEAERLAATVSLNREKKIVQGALMAMRQLAGEKPVAERLLEIAGSRPAEDASEIAVAIATDRREAALLALEGRAKVEQLPRFLAIALGDDEPDSLRDHAFDRILDVGSRDAIAPMWPLVQSSANQELPKRLRWRAGELVLALGGRGVVDEFMTKLPAAAATEYEPGELLGYATKMASMSDPPTESMRAALRGGVWFKAVIAANYLAERGDAGDVARLEALTGSKLQTRGDGWAGEPPRGTVGEAAALALATLRARLEGKAPKEGE